MTVASIDYVNARVTLDASTIGVDFDTLDAYKDERALRLSTPEYRNFTKLIIAGGNIQKTSTKYTSAYVKLVDGCRIIPYDTSQNLKVIRETFTDDGYEGVDCFDRSTLSPTSVVNIDYEVDKVEIRLVATGGSALTTQEHNWLASTASKVGDMETKVDEQYRISGLKLGEPMTVTKTARTAGTISMALTGDGVTTTTVTRQ